MSSLPLAALGGGTGFFGDPRYSLAPPFPRDQAPDPVTEAWAEGHAAGLAEAQAEAAAQRTAEEEARLNIELALARLDADQQEALRQRLVETVAALCNAALAPLAIDPALLAERAARAAAMLVRADDDAVLRLHPDDLKRVAKRLPAGLAAEADPGLEPGNLRLDGQAGGVEDGPAQWRRAIAEALGQC